ncbi:MAG: FAD-dependent oxidoreductase, partial [Clostridia bacterium]|nr:FAD-dependent oxidoreductase [Clostridia bacterium]
EKLVEQALEQGAEMDSCEVLSVEKDGDAFTLTTDGEPVRARAVILATGARHRTLGLPGEEDFIGSGVSFCAVCDGAFYRGARVAVVGGGNSALQEALLLSELAEKVIVVQNLDFLTGEGALQEQLYARSNVEVILGTVVDAYLGDGELAGIRVRREKDGSLSEIPVAGVFLAVGLIPQNEAFQNVLELDERGYAASDETCYSPTPGVFVAGDCRRKKIRQVPTAAADGAVAALAACDYLDGR